MDYRSKLSDLGIDVHRVRGGQGKVLCPKCSHTRKKKKDPCLSVNVREGWFLCHNCNWKGNVREIFNEKKKEYSRPAFNNRTDLDKSIVDWFFARGISQDTLIKSKITQDVVFFPQVNEKRACINFNYFRNGELINIKSRDHEKNFRLSKDAELIFYGLDNLKKDDRYIIITEGECFRGDAEILTRNGWVRFDEYNPSDDVMSVNDDMTSQFERPNYVVEKLYSGNLVEYSNHQKFYSLTTEGHDMVVEHNISKSISKKKAIDLKTGYSIPRVVNHNGLGLNLSDDQIRLCIAVSADFTIRKSGDLYCRLLKQRKINRLKDILDKCGIEYSLNIDGGGYSSFFIRRGNAPRFVFKEFPKEWISETTFEQKRLIVDEIRFWDGNEVPNRSQIEYSTTLYSNAVFVQTISHLCGYSSTIIKRKNKFGSWFKISILFNKKRTDTQCLIKNKKIIQHHGKVYCVNVSTGKILVRQNDCISVSGNCDALSFMEAGVDYAISVPNGASKSSSSTLEYLDNCWDYFDNDKIVILALDNDEPGMILREELSRRIGKNRCRKVDFKDVKDANDFLLKYGPEKLAEVVLEHNLIEYPLKGVSEVSDYWDDVTMIMENGLSKGITTGYFDELDEMISFDGSKLCVVTGIPNSGKSPMIDMIMLALSVRHGWKWGVCSMENKPTALYIVKLAEKLLGKFIRPGSPVSNEDKERIKNFLSNHFYFIEPNYDNNESDTLEFILDAAKGLVRKHGIKGLVIDPWNKIEHKYRNGESETAYVSRVLDDMIRFEQVHDLFMFLIAHPAKPKKTKMGEYEVPDLYSISGSANFYNKPDWGITVHRNYKTGLTELYVNKVKWDHLGKRGHCALKYNGGNGRLGTAHKPLDFSNWLDSMVFSDDKGKNYEPVDYSDFITNEGEIPEDAPF